MLAAPDHQFFQRSQIESVSFAARWKRMPISGSRGSSPSSGPRPNCSPCRSPRSNLPCKLFSNNKGMSKKAIFVFLYKMFNDWELVLAAYNGGPGYLSRAMRRTGKKDYWSIRPFLRQETQNYIPKLYIQQFTRFF